MKLFFLLVLLVVGVGSAEAQVYQIEHCFLGCPTGASEDNRLVIRSIYSLSYNTDLKTAQWVAYEVRTGAIGIASSLSRQPVVDDYVTDTLLAEDFLASEAAGLVRAHYVPLVSFAGTPYWNEVNYLTNVVARSNSLSQGAWYGLDWAIRNLVNRDGSVHVVTGPVFYADLEPRRLNSARPHRVPDAFFKVIVDRQGRAAAFLLAQETPIHRHHCDLLTTVEEIESLTGLNLFPESADNPELVLQDVLGCSQI